MRNWQETQRVFGEMSRLLREGGGGALASIVRLEGSAYRQPGAKLLVRDDGSLAGNVSAGCLESDVRETGLRVAADGKPVLRHYDTTGADDVVWGLGVGCGGKVDILVQPASGSLGAVLDIAQGLLAGDKPFAISTVISAGPDLGHVLVSAPGGIRSGTTGHTGRDAQVLERTGRQIEAGESAWMEAEGALLFTEVLVPPPHLVVCGATDDTMPVVRLAAEAGFRVTVADHRPAFLAEGRFSNAWKIVRADPGDAAQGIPGGPGVFAIVKTHIDARDREWVGRFVRGAARYVGLLASRRRREVVLRDLTPDERAVVYSPVGLDLGAEGPEQVAVSVVAELLAVFNGRAPGHLRDRKDATHARRP